MSNPPESLLAGEVRAFRQRIQAPEARDEDPLQLLDALCRTVENNALALSAGGIGTWLWDLRAGTVTIDPTLKRLLGYEDHELGDDPADWQKLVAPEDQERFLAAAEACRMGSSEHLHVQSRRRRKDGSVRWFLTRGAVVRDAAGSPVRLVGTDVDITELRGTEEQLSELFELSLGMLCIAGPDGYFKRVNPAFERTLGYSREELLARPFAELVHPADREATLAELHKLGRGEPTIHFENRYCCKDGSIRWLAWTAVPRPEDRLIYATATDVTERRQAEERLRESDQRFRQLLAAVPAYTYTVELENGAPVSTRHTWGCMAATGYAPHDFEANPLLWITIVHAEDRDMVREHVARVMAGVEAPPLEHRIVHRDGKVRWIRNTIVRHFDEDHHLVRYEGLVENITEGKRLENRFRRLLEAAPDAMVIVDERGTIVLVNAQTKRLFGYTGEELLGEPVEMLVPEHLREKHREYRQAYGSNPLVRPMATRPELCGLRKDGSEFPAEISLSPLETEEGILITSAIRDISERKRAERTIRDNEMQLLAAQRIQQRLLPPAAPRLEGFEIAGSLRPAEFAAGDYFDYLPMADGTLGVAVGDVSGHGFSAALLMATLRAHLRSLAKTIPDIDKILASANALLLDETEQDRFVTLLFTRLDPHSRKLLFASAGHPTGYIVDQAGNVAYPLESTGPPLAVLPEATFPLGRPVPLRSGDVVLLVTDGILEAESPHGTAFGWRRAVKVAQANRHRSAGEILETLHDAVRGFSGRPKPADDITAVVIKVLPEESQPVQ